MTDPTADKVLDEVLERFFGSSRPKRVRAKPHRCIDCGRVTKHVRCHQCMGSTKPCDFCSWQPR